MGFYPQNIELNFNYLKDNGFILQQQINQSDPRQIKNNMIFYKYKKLCTGPFNSAVITDDNRLLVQGENEFG